MWRAYLGVTAWSLGFALRATATDGIAAAPEHAATDSIEEVLVEAQEPQYAAPTMRDRIGRVWVPVMINGQGPFRLVLDTGATSSAILGSVAETLKLPLTEKARSWLQGVTGSAIVPHVIAETIEVGDLLLNDAKLVIVPDVFGGAQGVLGTQGLMDKRIHIDFRRDMVEIGFARGKPRPPGFAIQKFEVGRGRLAEFDLMVGGVRTRAIVDTGAQQTVGNESLREALLLRRRDAQNSDVIGVTLDVVQGQRIRVPPIAMGTVQVRNLHITFGEIAIFSHWRLTRDPAMLIGMDIIGTLEAFAIDYPRRELYLRARH